MNTSEVVEKVLKENPETRDNDRLLMLKVWQEQGLVLTPEQKALFNHVSLSESITRHRRKLQESGEYKANAKIESSRKNLAEETRAKINSNPEGISWLK